MLSFFIRDSWMQSAALSANGSWSYFNQLAVQLLGMGATIGLAVIGTLIIVFVVENTIGFRIEEQKEIEGIDQSLHGEHGYGLVYPDIRG
jgi:Amt family ammonium transporter